MSRKIPIALTMYSVRDDAAADYLGTVRRVAQMGYQGIQTHHKVVDASQLLRLAEDLGIVICGVHTPFEALRDNLEEVVEFNHALGCPDVTCPGLPGDYRTEAGFREAGKILEQIGSRLHDHDIRLTYHNHDFEFQDLGGKTGHELLFEAAGGSLECELDVYWAQFGGLDPVELIARFAGRLPLLHIKDMEAGEERFFAEIGKGVLDWPSIFQAANDAAVEWAIVEQDAGRRPAMDSARMSIDNLKKMGFA